MTGNEIKQIKALSQKKFRDESGLFVVEGEKMVSEAVRSGWKIKEIYRIEEIGETAMSRISSMSSPSPVLAVLEQRKTVTFDAEKGLYIALDSIRDPGNLGTIIRIADWFGADAVLCSPDTVELYNPKVVQSTMGAVFRVKVIYTDLLLAADKVHTAGGHVYGTFLSGSNIYGESLDTGVSSPSMVITGNESNGISRALETKVDGRLYIPPYPAGVTGSESLNAAVATAVTVAEFRRRLHG